MEARVPLTTLRLLAPLAAQAGIDLPGNAEFVPQISLDEKAIRVSEQLGGLLSKEDIFVRGKQIVTIESGTIEPVSRDRFCTLVEEWVICTKQTKGGSTEVTMGKEFAAKIMDCRQFTRRLRPLEGLIPVRIPARRPDGSISLIRRGYDEDTHVWCNDDVDYPVDLPVEEGLRRLIDYHSEFEFAQDGGGAPKDDLMGNRSFSVQIAALLSTYCRLLLPAGTPRPMFAWIANQQGSGKSVLAEGTIAPVYGDVATASNPETKEELSKLLDTAAQAHRPYLFLDDAPPFVASGALNRFITSRRHSGRILGSALEFDVPNVTTILITGNNLELTPDLLRRALVVELFVDGEIEGRTFRREIEPGFWSQPDVRRDVLAALWAIVRHWIDHGQPTATETKPTFESWSKLIGGIIAAIPRTGPAPRPMSRPDLPMAGDRRGDEARQLIMILAAKAADTAAAFDSTAPTIYTTTEIVEIAREEHLLEDLVGHSGDKALPTKELRRLGTELKRWRGRKFRLPTGATFHFGARRQRRGTDYPIVFESAGE